MTSKPPFYLTTAIAYTNAPPHIGFALELMYADVIARFERLRGKDVKFVTGTDEHGQKIAHKAAEAGMEPQAFVDEMSKRYRELASDFHISTTDFIRTTEERHRTTVEAFWNLVVARGEKDTRRGPYIYKKSYGGLYCVGCEQFKTEKELVDGVCPDHKKAPEYIEEENYFFRLSAFADDLKALYAERAFAIPEEKFNEAIQLVNGGLEDISISRSTAHLTWGIPVPGDPSQVVYVWFDALVNYLSALGFPENTDAVERYWPANVHVIGKEINRFHTVLWPAMLMAAGIETPRCVAIHGWIMGKGGVKMSKTLGNVLDPKELRDQYGVDASRYLLLRDIPFRADGEYVPERFASRYQADLANDLGNLVYRVTSMMEKYRDGVVPARAEGDQTRTWNAYVENMEHMKFDEALDETWGVIREANQFIDRTKPWALAKEGKQVELDHALYTLLETIRHVAWMIRPCMPSTSDRILDQLGVSLSREEMTLEQVSVWGGMEPGTKIASGEPLFPRIEIS